MMLLLLLLLSVSFAFETNETNAVTAGDATYRAWIKKEYYDGKHITLGYSKARIEMYNRIDLHNNLIECVYSGARFEHKETNSTDVKNVNCEHTVPQSFFNEKDPMKSDLNHLFPTYEPWNGMRSNYGFSTIDPQDVTFWLLELNKSSSVPKSSLDAYSRYQKNKFFEPRKVHSGNLARAVLYFFTMYDGYLNVMPRVATVEQLCAWHYADPVDAAELARNKAVAVAQGNGNPYIEHPEYLEKAWGCQKSFSKWI
eukprot:GAFH01003578.1.p1 GENE.GAFH01003578.1~~GAFH01003578.1.p1  ORF type:complete len:255 (-),score=77.07 GAFH01003578.1:157-921(-)